MKTLQEDFYGFPGGLNNRGIQNELFLVTSKKDLISGDRNGLNGFSNDLIYAGSGFRKSYPDSDPHEKVKINDMNH